MNINEVPCRDGEILAALVRIWEDSVRETHTFLTDAQIQQIKTYVPQALTSVKHLLIMENEAKHPIAFMGIEKKKLEMLFLTPSVRGKGVGKQLLQYAIQKYAVEEVIVNEQNPQASGFYEHMGFHVYHRSDIDEQGNPYPILYMRYQAV